MFSHKWLTTDGKEHKLVDIKDCAMIEGDERFGNIYFFEDGSEYHQSEIAGTIKMEDSK